MLQKWKSDQITQNYGSSALHSVILQQSCIQNLSLTHEMTKLNSGQAENAVKMTIKGKQLGQHKVE